MFNEAYTILFVLSFIMLIILISRYSQKISINYILLFACVLISNLGYMQLSDAKSLDQAIVSNQTVYMGACFAPFYLFMCIADLCKGQVYKWFKVLLFTLSVVVLIFVSTYGLTDLYYKNVSMLYVDGVTILDKEYGPMHTLYPLYLFITVGAAFVMILK